MKTSKKNIIAICYDFDKTLSPDDMQAQGYIQSLGYTVEDFWKETNEMAKEYKMDGNLAYMLKMVQESGVLTKEDLIRHGEKVRLFPGVTTWFQRINEYAEQNGITVEHYIISSGIREMIEGTKIAKAGSFKEIFANSFYYDKEGKAMWPAQMVNYTNKTQFLFRIEKGILDVTDPGVNEYQPDEDSRIPFRNMVYIGDSDTDVPCMKLVTMRGGHAIGVYDPKTKNKDKVYKMIEGKRIRYFCPANYGAGSEIENLLKMIIDKTVATEALENKYMRDLAEIRSWG